jgi:DsbC/DsbD-like thiol-disulfide interchange protein
MKRSFSFASGLCLALAMAACSKVVRVERGNGGGLGPGQASTPAVISSSEQVVKVASAPVSISPNSSAEAVVTLSISPGFHINANPATFSYLIATEVTPGKMANITAGSPTYPAPVKKKFQFAEQPLAVYEGQIPIKLTLRAEKNATSGPLSVPITVRVQACDEEKCFPPATVSSTISVIVK